MTDSPIEFPWKRRVRRRPTRFRAVVESLDRRQLMAADVTGVAVMYVNGTARNPLPVYGAPQTPPFGTLGAIFPLEPVGTPVPLVTLTSASPDPLSSTGYSGTVNWGDGSATDAALFGTFTSPGLIPQPVNTLFVNGPDHTYQTPGLYPIIVSVTGPGDSAPTVYHATASITLAVSGQLNPLSDRGFFNNDSITSVRKVDYVGTTLPGTTVVLSAMNASTGKTVVVGSGVADASGVWNITTTPLADGSYQILAYAHNPAGDTASATLSGYFNSYYARYLVIDAGGPKVTSFKVIDARTGTFQVSFSDPANLFVGPLTDPASYTVTVVSAQARKGRKVPVASLTLDTLLGATIGPAPPVAYPPATVTGTLGTGAPLITGSGSYIFTIHSAGIISLSGAALDGEYTGKYPTGNGVSGGDFQVKINVRNGKASGPIRVTPMKTRHHG